MNLSSFVAELKSRVSIIQVCEKYMTLSQKGGRWWGCCPFHHEKTPSFSVSENGFYHCFGCGESGDVIKFVQQMEGTDFVGACELLAKSAGMEMPRFSRGSDDDAKKAKERKDVLLALLRETAIFYLSNLKTDKGSIAREYLAKRGFQGESFKLFGFGYSPDYSSLPQYLHSKGYKKEDMVAVGVCDEKNGRTYDSLAGRLIIPIIDNFKNVVAFGGRSLVETDFAKYKNTKETEIFHKSKVLYGLNVVKEHRKNRKIEELIIVEGYMDAISLFFAGYDNVVASMGTALTKEQARLMKFFVSKVYISYDGDGAGKKATIRGMDILEEEGLEVRICSLPDSLDPDDVIRKGGKEAFDVVLKESLPVLDYKIKLIDEKFDLKDKLERRKYIDAYLRVTSKVKENFTRTELLSDLARKTGADFDSLRLDLQEVIKNGKVSREDVPQNSEKTASVDPAKEEKNFLFYMLVSGGKTLQDLGEVAEIFSDREIEIANDFASMKMPISSLFDYLGPDTYEVLKQEDVELKDIYFSACLKKQRERLYTAKIGVAMSKLKIARTQAEKAEITNEILKYKQKIYMQEDKNAKY